MTSAELVEYAVLGTAGTIVAVVAFAFVVAFGMLVRDDIVPALRDLARWARRHRRRS